MMGIVCGSEFFFTGTSLVLGATLLENRRMDPLPWFTDQERSLVTWAERNVFGEKAGSLDNGTWRVS